MFYIPKALYSQLKASDGSHRVGQNGGVINSSGFTGLLAGDRDATGRFSEHGKLGIWRNSTDDGGYGGWSYSLNFADGTFTLYNWYKQNGFSVRCIRN